MASHLDKKREKLQKQIDKYSDLLSKALSDRELAIKAKAQSATVQSHVQIRAYQEKIDNLIDQLDALDPEGDIVQNLPDEEIISDIKVILTQIPEELGKQIFQELKKKYG